MTPLISTRPASDFYEDTLGAAGWLGVRLPFFSHMRNAHTGFKIVVIAPQDGPPFVLVPTAQLDDVREILVENGIVHTVGAFLTGARIAPQQLLHLDPPCDRGQVQILLDRVR